MAGGRPRIEIDDDQFKKLCALQCTLEEISSWFKCSEDTIERWCRREHDMSFADYYKRNSANGKISLRRWQFAMAEHSVPMAIFLGKNWLGQTDRMETTIADINPTERLEIEEFLNDGNAEGDFNQD